MNVKEEFLNIVSDYTGMPASEIDPDQNFKFSVGLDSFGMLSMITAVEDNFDIDFPDDKLKEFTTLADIISFIEEEKQK